MDMTTCGNNAILCRPEFVDPAQEPFGLWWCGDILDMEALSINAVCKSVSAAWSEINTWADWLSQFPYILVAMPDGPSRDEIVSELSVRSPIPVLVPDAKDFFGTGSIRELRENVGLGALDRLLLNAEEVPIQGILDIAEVDIEKRKNARRVLSGLPSLDRAVGGFSGGGLSVWTGKRGEGKSTLLGQILLDAVNQGHIVCAYSGEMPADSFKLSLLQQAAGYLNVFHTEDPYSGRSVFQVKPEVVPEINEWWRRRLFLIDIRDKNAHDEDSILTKFKFVIRRFGADVFLVDNIMTAHLRGEAELGYYRAQSKFAGDLADFCDKFNVHVHLVAHPRKTDKKNSDRFDADDISGSGDIANRADNVFNVQRVAPEVEGCDAIVTILKNREFGARGRIKLDFNEPSRRLYPAGGSPAKQYSWEMKMRNG